MLTFSYYTQLTQPSTVGIKCSKDCLSSFSHELSGSGAAFQTKRFCVTLLLCLLPLCKFLFSRSIIMDKRKQRKGYKQPLSCKLSLYIENIIKHLNVVPWLQFVAECLFLFLCLDVSSAFLYVYRCSVVVVFCISHPTIILEQG